MSEPIPWQDLSYLRQGNARQQAAYRVLRSLRVFEILRAYTPVLVGTIPLDIDLPHSDLDIICEAHDLAAFEACVEEAFDQQPGFRLKHKRVNDLSTLVAKFSPARGGMPVEVFGQPRAVTAQNAYRHMLVEARLLEIGGPGTREAIRDLKRVGLKTEPAFARHFGLPGDPFETLLCLSDLDGLALRAFIREAQCA